MIPDLYLCSTGKAMMLLNLKSTRHLLTTPNMQAESTKDPGPPKKTALQAVTPVGVPTSQPSLSI